MEKDKVRRCRPKGTVKINIWDFVNIDSINDFVEESTNQLLCGIGYRCLNVTRRGILTLRYEGKKV